MVKLYDEYILEYVSNEKLAIHHLQIVVNKVLDFLKRKNFTEYSVDNYHYNQHVLRTKIYVYCDKYEIRKFKFDSNKEIVPISWDLHEIAQKWFEKNSETIRKFVDTLKSSLLKYNFVLSVDMFWDVRFGKVKMDIILYLKNFNAKRIKPQKYVYHSSPEQFRQSILQNGLLPKENKTHNWCTYLDYPPAIFAINPTHKNLEFWSEHGDVWKINTEKLPNKWYYDLNLSHIRQDAIMTFEPIPKEYIKLYKGAKMH